jgi:hypothetical protein
VTSPSRHSSVHIIRPEPEETHVTLRYEKGGEMIGTAMADAAFLWPHDGHEDVLMRLFDMRGRAVRGGCHALRSGRNRGDSVTLLRARSRVDA